MAEFKYKAFISYSHADEKWAKWLHRSLESYRVPKRVVHALASNRLIPIFRDRDELASSGDLSATIQQALANSENLIVICSQAAAQSRWVNEEIRQFVLLGRSSQIFCLLVDDPDVSFPPAMISAKQGAAIEPLAADPRRDSDGKRGALLKIAAGLLGVGFDDLRRREAMKRQKRLAALLVASLAVTGTTTGMAIYAFFQKQRADTERERAETEATAAAQVSAFLIGLFEISDPERALGETVTARELLDVGARRVDQHLTDSPLLRARMMRVMGEVYRSLGLFEEAVALLERSVAAYNGLVPVGQAEAIRAQRILAEVYLSLGRAAESRTLLESLILIGEESWAPDHPDLALVLSSYSHVLLIDRDLDAAREHLQRALDIQQRKLDRNDPAIADTLVRIAGAEMELGSLDVARESAERAVEIYRANYDEVHPDTQTALTVLSSIYGELGDDLRAARTLEGAVEAAERILGPEHPRLAGKLNELGIQYGYAGRGEEAVKLLERSLTIFESTFGPASAQAALARGNLAWAQHVTGQHALAARNFEIALEHSVDELQRTVLLLDYARLEVDRGNYAKSVSMLQRCVELREAVFGADSARTQECIEELDDTRGRMSTPR